MRKFNSGAKNGQIGVVFIIGLPDGTPYNGKRCLITQEAIHSKAQKSPFTG